MNPQKKKIFKAFLIGAMGGILIMFAFNYFSGKKDKSLAPSVFGNTENLKNGTQNLTGEISEITKAETVINYVKSNRKLPDFYLTKNEAKKAGWIPSKQNLCEVLPGKAIGGDNFGNREKLLPQNNQYFEADVNYNCGNRTADRIVYTKNGDVYLSTDHYKSFQQK